MENHEEMRGIIKKGRIETKRECYLLYGAGYFGNKARTWDSYAEILKSGWKGLVCIRGRNPINRGKVVYNVSLENVPKKIKEFVKQGTPEKDLSFNQSMPDGHLLIQGETMRSYRGLELWYTTKKCPMNSALKEESIYEAGLKAKLIL